MKAIIAIAVVALLSTTVAGHAWQSLFPPPYENCPSIMLGISCPHSTVCYVPGGQSGSGPNAGFSVYHFDGQPNGQFTKLTETKQQLFSISISVRGSKTAPHGAVGGFGFTDGIEYLVNATTFAPGTAPFLTVINDLRTDTTGQYVFAFGNDAMSQDNYVFYSSDYGATFTPVNIAVSTVTKHAAVNWGAAVGSSTIYAAFGDYPHHPRTDAPMPPPPKGKAAQLNKRINERVEIRNGKYHVTPIRDLLATPTSGLIGQYAAQIAKSTDAGKTWTTVFEHKGEYTLDTIDCISATHCVAVGSGYKNSTSPGTRIFLTTDGEKFEQVLFLTPGNTQAVGLNSVRFQSETTVWIGGSIETQTSSSGVFYVSNDGGKTWSQAPGTIPYIGAVMQISDFSEDDTGFAVAISEFQDSTILRYGHASGTPAPTWGGNFTQKQYNASETCTGPHTTLSLPQNKCLQLNGGGSATAQCQDGIIMQMIYPLSNTCTGPSEPQPQPLNQCLKAQGGQSFENFCGPAAEAMNAQPAPAGGARLMRRN